MIEIVSCRNILLENKYELIKPIGEGGNGIVYLAWDRHLECMVAIKENKLLEDSSSMNVLRNEMEFLKSLKHPMLPAVIDYFDTDKRYLVMEYIEGENLCDYIEKEGKIAEDTACEWAMQLLDLLLYLHSQKPAIIYRDLKPENIILCKDSKVRVVDFGSACCMHYNGNLAENMAGTIGYAAPEQFDGLGKYSAVADERSDIYNFGATLYHMLTGFNPSLPPCGIRPPRFINPQLTAGIDKIVLNCTQAEPSKRYQSVEEIRKDMMRRKYIGKKGIFLGIGRGRRYVIKRLEKNICLTDKKTIGLV